MQLWLFALVLILLAAPVGANEPGTVLADCASTANEIVSLVDDAADADRIAAKFPPNITDPPEYFRALLRVLLREYGHPTDTVLDDELDLSAFTEYGIVGRGLDPPFRTFKYRTTFHHEGDGLLAVKIGRLGDECRLAELRFGLPRSRPDALQRHYEINKQIADELAAVFR